MKICKDCEKELAEDEPIFNCGDEFLCEECFDKDYTKCGDCDTVIHVNDSYDVDGNLVCDKCCNDNYFTCDDCGEVFHNRKSNDISNDYKVCDRCSENYIECANCDTIIHVNDSYYCEDCDSDYCEGCYNDHHQHENDIIKEYDYKPCFNFYGNNDKLFLGIELEVENTDNNDNDSTVENYVTYNELYCKSDGSLDSGFEIVSHPMTLEYHHKFSWKKILENLKSKGYKSHNTDTCGLHIHINKSFYTLSEMIKLGIFVNTQKPKMEKLGRRTNNSYAKFKDIKKGELKDSHYNHVNRYEAINWNNCNTIEFRFPKGTLKYETFISTIELIHAVCNFIKTISIVQITDIDKSWTKFCKFIEKKKEYKNLVIYMKTKNLMVEIAGEVIIVD